MLDIQYSNQPITTEACINKPLALANKSFPYNEIADSRRFEELLYSICHTMIGKNKFQLYDSVSLMSGVRDKGRDCAFFTHGASTGIIQCKKYKELLKKSTFGQEITKFILYSLLDNRLIPNPSEFTYYIVVSNGLESDCRDFIDGLRHVIDNENDFEKWVSKNLKQPTLQSLSLPDTLEKVRRIIKLIKVETLIPADLDMLLSDPECLKFVPLFFEVKSVVDNSVVQALEKKVTNYINQILDEPVLRSELMSGSSSLQMEPNEFEEIYDSHIERKETAELLNWISIAAEKDSHDKELNICLLAGNAGIGKTVILKDLYDSLTIEGIPALGLKADKLHAVNLSDLKDKIGLPIPILDFVKQCKANYTKTIIIIDQIDALSQSMSADRSFLQVFNLLIQNFKHDPNIRLIISIRTFDLNHDSSLRIYKNLKTINVEILDENIVLQQLEKINITKVQLNGKLLQLLRTPNHLNIFSRIAKKLAPKYNSINSLQSLYTELFEQKILSIENYAPVQSSSVKALLFKIANKMFEQQSITISEHHFEDYFQELKYLESQRLLKKEDKQIQFFHQTFYDYIFAKQFVENNWNLIDYILEQDQSIFIRSAVKMIISYLREIDKIIYIKTINQILSDRNILFHIKQMVFITVLTQEHPTTAELEFVVSVTKIDQNFHMVFFEHATAVKWLYLAIDKKLMSAILESEISDAENYPSEEFLKYCQMAIAWFLNRFIEQNDERAWKFVIDNTQDLLKREILIRISDWPNKSAYILLEQCSDFNTVDPFAYFMVLKNIAKNDPKYSFEKLKQRYLDEDFLDRASRTKDQEKELLNELSKSIPSTVFNYLIQIIKKDLKKNEATYENINNDHLFTDVELQDDQFIYGYQYLYWQAAQCLRLMAKDGNEEFLLYANQNNKSTSVAIIRLIVFALKESEIRYTSVVFQLFYHLVGKDYYITSSDLGTEFIEVFEKAFPAMSLKQQQDILKKIPLIRIKGEARIWPFAEKLKLHMRWGLTQHVILLAIPQQTIDANSELLKLQKELQRKVEHWNYTKYQTSRGMAGFVHRPLREDAYAIMSVRQWLKSFLKYNEHRQFSMENHLKGGLSEHSYAFRDYAKNFPNKKFEEIVSRSISNTNIHRSYPILGLSGLSEAKYDPLIVHHLFKDILPTVENIYESSLVTVATYLVESNIDDQNLIKYLQQCALNWKNTREYTKDIEIQTSLKGLMHRGLNSNYGFAVTALIQCKILKYEDIIFETIEKILREGPREAKALVIYYFACLNSLNLKRSYTLFLDYLQDEDDIYIIASGIWGMQFMAKHDFRPLIPIFEKLIRSNTLGKDDSKTLFSILYFSYLRDTPNAEPLLLELLKNSPMSRDSGLRDIIRYFNFNKTAPEKSKFLLTEIINFAKKDLENKLDFNHLHLEGINLTDIRSFLEAIITMPNYKITGDFIEYLKNQCSINTIEAIEVFNFVITNNKLNVEDYRVYHNDELTRFIVGAFNALKENDSESKFHRKQLLHSFDNILSDYKYRSRSEKILDELL
jgi:hypothetical protein